MRRRITTAILLTLALASTGTAQAASVTIEETTLAGNTATVIGTATFPAITTPQNVGGTKTPFSAATAAAGEAAGLNLVQATISPIQDGLRFTWHLSSMPEQTPLEGIRYTWSFKIGETNYQLQAKRVNLASTTTVEDPVGHVNRATSQQDFFQLRGACEPQYQGLPLAGCYHLTFLNGAFDPANKQVRVDLPFRARDRLGRIVAEDFVPGVVLESSLQAGASISAAFQAVVTYNDYPVTQLGRGFMSTYINEWSPYYIGGRVQLGVGSHLASPADVTYGSPVTLSAGRFTATISGLSSTNNTVFVRACNGVTCSYASKRLIGG